MLEIFQYSFMVRAFLAGIVIAITAPLIGNFLVIRRFSLIADTLSHMALVGVAIGLLTGTQPLVVTIGVTILAALLIEKLRSNRNIAAESVLAMFLPGGLALSLVIISLAHGFNTNLFNYLFGSITTVQANELWLVVVLGLATVITVVGLYKQLLSAALDEESAKVNGINVELVNSILMILTAITISLSMRIVGVLLIGALMVIPGVTAMQIAKSFQQTMYLSVVFALIAVLVGLFAAYYLNIPAGASIVLLSLAIFGVVAIVKRK
ncbi:MAG: zinc transport system permease protein [Microgenomates group bacterium Gr01-1014_16]|nr:MAG: zinc transport system permease protein [Microgenomates group bacterium Gr01-1014_16]